MITLYKMSGPGTVVY